MSSLSSLSSSSSSDAENPCVDVCPRFAGQPDPSNYDCAQEPSEVSNPNVWLSGDINNGNPPEVREGESWDGSNGDDLINNGGVVTNNQLGDILTDNFDTCYTHPAIYQAVANGIWSSTVPITQWSQPWHLLMQGRTNSGSSGVSLSQLSEGPARLSNNSATNDVFNDLLPGLNNVSATFRKIEVAVDSCFTFYLTVDPCSNNLVAKVSLESGWMQWNDNGRLRTINAGGWIAQRYLDGANGIMIDSSGNSDTLGAPIPFGQLFQNQPASQRLTLRVDHPHMITKVEAGDTYLGG